MIIAKCFVTFVRHIEVSQDQIIKSTERIFHKIRKKHFENMIIGDSE